MGGARHVYLTFDLMAISNEPLELGVWDSVWRVAMNISMNSLLTVFYAEIADIVELWNVIRFSDKFRVVRICKFSNVNYLH